MNDPPTAPTSSGEPNESATDAADGRGSSGAPPPAARPTPKRKRKRKPDQAPKQAAQARIEALRRDAQQLAETAALAAHALAVAPPPSELPATQGRPLPLSRAVRALKDARSPTKLAVASIILALVPLVFGTVYVAQVPDALHLDTPVLPGPLVALCFAISFTIASLVLTVVQLRTEDPGHERWDTLRYGLGTCLVVGTILWPVGLGVVTNSPGRPFTTGQFFVAALGSLGWFLVVRFETLHDRALGHDGGADGPFSAFLLGCTAVMALLAAAGVFIADRPTSSVESIAAALGAQVVMVDASRTNDDANADTDGDPEPTGGSQPEAPTPCLLDGEAYPSVPEDVLRFLRQAQADFAQMYLDQRSTSAAEARAEFDARFGCPGIVKFLGNGVWAQDYVDRAATIIATRHGAGVLLPRTLAELGDLGDGSHSTSALQGQVTTQFPCGPDTTVAGVAETDGSAVMLAFQTGGPDAEVLPVPSGMMAAIALYVADGEVPVPTARFDPDGAEATQAAVLAESGQEVELTGPYRAPRFADPDEVADEFTIDDLYLACNPDATSVPQSLTFAD